MDVASGTIRVTGSSSDGVSGAEEAGSAGPGSWTARETGSCGPGEADDKITGITWPSSPACDSPGLGVCPG